MVVKRNNESNVTILFIDDSVAYIYKISYFKREIKILFGGMVVDVTGRRDVPLKELEETGMREACAASGAAHAA